MTLHTSSPQRQVGKDRREGALYYYVGWHERVKHFFLIGGISLLSVVGKVYGRVLINRIRDTTENVIAEVQGGFRRGRGCTDQIFVVMQICEKYLGKGKDVYFAFLDLEKAYDKS